MRKLLGVIGSFITGFVVVFTGKMLYYSIRDRNRVR